ncbi:unnamed protein product [Camellia sinensis]
MLHRNFLGAEKVPENGKKQCTGRETTLRRFNRLHLRVRVRSRPDPFLVVCRCFSIVTSATAILCISVNILSAIRSFKDGSNIFDGIFRCYAVVIVMFVVVAETEWGFIIKFWKVLEYWAARGGIQVKLCGIAQYGNLIGVTIGYTITTSISMVFWLERLAKKAESFQSLNMEQQTTMEEALLSEKSDVVEEKQSFERWSSYQFVERAGSIIPTASLAGTEVSVDEIQSVTASSDRYYLPSLHAPLISSPEPDPNEQALIYQGGYGGDYGGISNEFQSCANNLIPMEIAHKIAEKIKARETFAAYIVIPMWPEGNPTEAYTKDFILAGMNQL